MEEHLKWYCRPKSGTSWQVDTRRQGQTLRSILKLKVNGFIYIARLTKEAVQSTFICRQDAAKAAKHFLERLRVVLRIRRGRQLSITIKHHQYGVAIGGLKMEGKCPENLEHRQVKYLNNIIEADHGKLKRLINPVRGFKSVKTAYATIKGL